MEFILQNIGIRLQDGVMGHRLGHKLNLGRHENKTSIRVLLVFFDCLLYNSLNEYVIYAESSSFYVVFSHKRKDERMQPS